MSGDDGRACTAPRPAAEPTYGSIRASAHSWSTVTSTSSANSGSASGELVVAPENGCSALRFVRSNCRHMLMSTPLSRLIVRHSWARDRMSPVGPPSLATFGNHCRSTCPAVPVTFSLIEPHDSVPVIVMPVWKYEYVSACPKHSILPLYAAAPSGTGARDGVTCRSSLHRVAVLVGAAEAHVVGVGHQLALLVATGPPHGSAGAAVVCDVQVVVGELTVSGAMPPFLFVPRHVVVGVRAVGAVVEVEQRKRVEVGDDGLAGPVLVEDRQEGELAVGFPGQFAGEEPGVRLEVRVIGLGGGEDQLRVARHQLERIPTPVITHSGTPDSFFAMLAVIATLARRAVTP